MTKSIIDAADAYAYEKALVGLGVGADKAAKSDIHAAVRHTDAARSALVEAINNQRTAIIESLTGEMPEPWGRVDKRGRLLADWDESGTALFTIDQLREYAAGLVAKKDAEITELKQRMVDGVTVQQYINIDNEVDALRAEVERLTAASVAWCEMEKKL